MFYAPIRCDVGLYIRDLAKAHRLRSALCVFRHKLFGRSLHGEDRNPASTAGPSSTAEYAQQHAAELRRNFKEIYPYFVRHPKFLSNSTFLQQYNGLENGQKLTELEHAICGLSSSIHHQ